MSRQVMAMAAAVLVLASVLVTSPQPAQAHHSSIRGYVTDATTGAPIADACVTVGPPIRCFTKTDSSGFYLIDLAELAARDGQTWDLYFLKLPAYPAVYSEKFVVNGAVTFNQPLMPAGRVPACAAEAPGTPTQTVYLPNVTKTLGGPDGWQTPFIVQNTGTDVTDLEVTFSRFLNGQCVARRMVRSLKPGTSFADIPNKDTDLPGDTQFAVVVRSFGQNVVAVVNEHAGSGSRAESLAYTGASQGSKSVFLPNVTRRFFGYVTPFVIQNVGTGTTTATARFVSFDGSAPTVTLTRSVDAGKSTFVDPNSDDAALGARGLVDGKQYGVTVTASQPLMVIVNTHNDAPGVAAPVAYSTNGVTGGGAAVYGAYAARNADGGRLTTIVVQNLGTTDITPTLAFTPLGSRNAPQLFISPRPVPPGGSWAFDPRFTLGTTTPCSAPSATCLGDGEYSFVARSGSEAPIAAQVNAISPTTAMGYTASATPGTRFFLPNVTRTLCACATRSRDVGWTTPLLIQNVSATSGASLRWYRFSDGALVHEHTVEVAAGSAVRVDPRDIAQLTDDTQYSVVVAGGSGDINALVLELAPGGDNAMAYEGFPAPATAATSE